MRSYLLTAKAEVLYEKTFGILAKYTAYLNNTADPFDCVQVLAEKLAEYPPQIIGCEDEKTFAKLEKNINEYDRIIDNINTPLAVGA